MALSRYQTIDLGDLCTHCGKDSRYSVSRTPSGTGGWLELVGGVGIFVDIIGFICKECIDEFIPSGTDGLIILD